MATLWGEGMKWFLFWTALGIVIYCYLLTKGQEGYAAIALAILFHGYKKGDALYGNED